jgi:hypothetical protein
MFRCDHCQTEYGGIRGVIADRCPRCAELEGPAISVRRVGAVATRPQETLGVTRSGAIVAISRQ